MGRTANGNGLFSEPLVTKFNTNQEDSDISEQVSIMVSIVTLDMLSPNSTVDVLQALSNAEMPDVDTARLGLIAARFSTPTRFLLT